MNYLLYTSVLDFFSRLFGFLMGFFTGLLLIVMFVGTAVDIAYMCNPLAQTAMDKLLDGKRVGGFRFISKDAVLACEESATDGKQVLMCYLKRRIKTYIIITIILYLLMIGPAPMVNYLWDVLQPLLKTAGMIK